MDDDLTEYPTQRLRLYPCQICGRQFNSEALTKHQAVCRKVSKNKRKVFDAGKQRATDSDVPYKATRKTAQIYTGEVRAQDDRSKYGSKPNWREKHQQLIRSIREARTVTRAMKEGGPLPAFRPSEVPSDYVNCPYCHRNFNKHSAERHIPFCESQHGRKQVPNNSRVNQQLDRGRTLPPQQQSAQYRQQQSHNTSGYQGSHDIYNNGYKHSNSAPMIVRRNPSDYQQPPPQPPPRNTSGDNSWSFRKLFGLGPKQQPMPYAPEEEDYYEQPVRHPVQQQPARHLVQQQPVRRPDQQQPVRRPVQQQPPPVLMRTGRTQENTSLNVRARQRSDEGGPYTRQVPPPQQAPSSYGRTQHQYGNNQSNSMRPTAIARPPPSKAIRCGDCGSIFNNNSGRYCPQCGSRR